MSIAKLRSKTATALDMGAAGQFVVLTREEAEAVLAEIDGRVRVATLPPSRWDDDEHVDGQQLPGPNSRLLGYQ